MSKHATAFVITKKEIYLSVLQPSSGIAIKRTAAIKLTANRM